MGKKTRRLTEYILTFIFIVTLNFFIPRLMPGDPFIFLSSEEGDTVNTLNSEQIEMYKSYYGMDKPLHIQYYEYIKNLFRGNIGYSIYYKDSVFNIIKLRARWTIPIVLLSTFLSCLLGVIIGSVSAWYQDSYIDKIIYSIMIFLNEIPSFLIGIIFLFILAAKYQFFPLSGGNTTFKEFSNSLEMFKDLAYHATLPIMTLVISRMGGFYLLARNSMMTVLSKDYIRTAEAKGLRDRLILFKHALRNAIIPIITRLFLSLGMMFGGAVLIENVFQYPGIGVLMREAIYLRDYPLMQGIFIFIAIMVLLMNFLADIVYEKLDPRIDI